MASKPGRFGSAVWRRWGRRRGRSEHECSEAFKNRRSRVHLCCELSEPCASHQAWGMSPGSTHQSAFHSVGRTREKVLGRWETGAALHQIVQVSVEHTLRRRRHGECFSSLRFAAEPGPPVVRPDAARSSRLCSLYPSQRAPRQGSKPASVAGCHEKGQRSSAGACTNSPSPLTC